MVAIMPRIINLSDMDKVDLKGMNRVEIERFALDLGLKPFHGQQIFRWIYQEGVLDFDSMTDISRQIRSNLPKKTRIGNLAEISRLASSDGSSKFLFGLYDGYRIESILIPEKNRLTLCVSSQAGCALGCRFCATGAIGFKRNLSAGEIVDQYLKAQQFASERISNVVFMGMGEPTLNLKNVLKACDILCDDYGPSLSRKRITISTVGVVHALRRFVSSAGKLGLAISLHSSDEDIRRRIMPVAKDNSIQDILVEARRYTETWGRRVSFEYLLLGGINDSIIDARKLVKMIHDIPCKINLIKFNPVDGLLFNRPSEENVQKFKEYLYPRTYAVMVRESRGLDISGACGQLAASNKTCSNL